MKVFFDKFFDGALVFTGVFFAFFFNQCQQGKMLKEELKFNLAEIMQSLPNEKPSETVDNFIFKQMNKEDGYCPLAFDVMEYEKSGSARYFEVILKRGLGSYLKESDKSILSQLSDYFDAHLPAAEAASLKFSKLMEAKVQEYLLASRCFSNKEILAMRNSMRAEYMTYQRKRMKANVMGYEIYKKLKSMKIELTNFKGANPEVKFQIKDYGK